MSFSYQPVLLLDGHPPVAADAAAAADADADAGADDARHSLLQIGREADGGTGPSGDDGGGNKRSRCSWLFALTTVLATCVLLVVVFRECASAGSGPSWALGGGSSSSSSPVSVAAPLRVAIVISVTPDRLLGERNEDMLLSVWNCYGLRRGYAVYYEPLVFPQATNGSSTQVGHPAMQSGRAFFWGRLRSWRKYLEHVDVLLAIDGDTLVVDQKARIEDWIRPHEHVVLQHRGNGGICAGMMLIRNSPQGRQFFDEWLQLEPLNHIDADNGDLHMMLMQLKFGRTGYPCEAELNAGRTNVAAYLGALKCVQREYGATHFADTSGGITVHPAHSGPFRDFGFATQGGIKWAPVVPHNCLQPRDFIVHSKSVTPLLEQQDWRCEGAESSNWPRLARCPTEPLEWVQCSDSEPTNAGFVGSWACRENNRANPCNLTGSDWNTVCDPVLKAGPRLP